MQIGLIGLPNVGKSTIFNLITGAKAEVANYPFCTIEPNTGMVEVPDFFLPDLARIAGSARQTPAGIKVLDVAGLVKGASKGEGLGNQFLSHIRTADILGHVVKCFTAKDEASQVQDPAEDVDIINTEMLLSDIELMGRREEKLKSLARTGDKDAAAQLEFTRHLTDSFNQEMIPDIAEIPASMAGFLEKLDLLSYKPIVYVANMDDSPQSDDMFRKLEAKVGSGNAVKVFAELESEIMELEPEERERYAEELGITGSLESFINTCYSLLDLITFYTLNENEARAWPLPRKTKVIDAAGMVHSDFKRGFVKAEVVNANDLIQYGSIPKAREKGKVMLEGKEYIVADRDVVYIRFAI